jgi:hypothetical protein
MSEIMFTKQSSQQFCPQLYSQWTHGVRNASTENKIAIYLKAKTEFQIR